MNVHLDYDVDLATLKVSALLGRKGGFGLLGKHISLNGGRRAAAAAARCGRRTEGCGCP